MSTEHVEVVRRYEVTGEYWTSHATDGDGEVVECASLEKLRLLDACEGEEASDE